jgi:hypothetical protein
MAADGQETVDSVVTPEGTVESDQVEPPLLVTMMEAKFPPSSPTATQVADAAEELDAQATARTFTSGVYVAAVCHCGVDADADVVGAALPRNPTRAIVVSAESAAIAIPLTVRTATSRAKPKLSNYGPIVALAIPGRRSRSPVKGRC